MRGRGRRRGRRRRVVSCSSRRARRSLERWGRSSAEGDWLWREVDGFTGVEVESDVCVFLFLLGVVVGTTSHAIWETSAMDVV